MGGFGSGNWYGWKLRKTTVEESLVVSMKDFRKQLYRDAAGTITWTWTSGGKSSVGYRIAWNQYAPTLTLHYRLRDNEDVRISVRLEMTPTQFGGRRWWFTCPLSVRGLACHQRADKLYLPPGARYFGCRTCHNLTYRSSQLAHQDDRLLAHVGIALGADAHARRLLMARLRDQD
jgi:hypothetical protein